MLDPYRMIAVNIFTSLLVLGGTLIYKFIFPKKKINLFVLLVTISLLPVISIFRIGDYESGDFNIHVYRTISFYQNLLQGNFLPSWAGELNATYGYPVFIFLNPLPYYLQSIIHFLGISFINSLKILLATSYIFSGIFFYAFMKKETKNSFAAFCGAIIYLFTPYHLIDLHFRATVGEVVFFAFLPLFFYSFLKLKERKNIQWFIISSLIFSLMVLSHQAMALFSLIIIIPYFIYHALKSGNFLKQSSMYLSTVILGLIYSVYTWIPHLIYPKYTLAYLLSDKIVSFPKLQELFYSTWIYGFLFQGHKGELSFLIGYTQILVLIVGLIFVFRFRKKIKGELYNFIVFWTAISFLIVFLITPFSWIFWKTIPILNTTQFSTRLLLLLDFSISALGAYLLIIFKKFPLIIAIFLIITIGYTMLNWGNRRLIPQINDAYLINNLPKSTAEGEGFCCMAQPKWTLPDAKWMSVVPRNHIEIIKGRGQVQQINRTDTLHEYVTHSDETLSVKENTWYFPGWKLFIDGKEVQIDFTNKKYPGIISFTIPAGLHRIVLTYQDITELLIAKVISISTIAFSLILLLLLPIKKLLKKARI